MRGSSSFTSRRALRSSGFLQKVAILWLLQNMQCSAMVARCAKLDPSRHQKHFPTSREGRRQEGNPHPSSDIYAQSLNRHKMIVYTLNL